MKKVLTILWALFLHLNSQVKRKGHGHIPNSLNDDHGITK